MSFALGLLFDNYLLIDSMFFFWAAFMGCLGVIWFLAICTKEYHSLIFVNYADKNTAKISTTKIGFCRKLFIFWSQINLFKLRIIFSFFVLGVSYGVIDTFLFIRLYELGASTMLMGLTL
eukprot:862652_1